MEPETARPSAVTLISDDGLNSKPIDPAQFVRDPAYNTLKKFAKAPLMSYMPLVTPLLVNPLL